MARGVQCAVGGAKRTVSRLAVGGLRHKASPFQPEIRNPKLEILNPMRKANFHSILLIFSAIILFASCGPGRKVSKTDLKANTPEAMLKLMAARKIDVQWMEAKAKLDLNDGSQSIKANAVIRMKKDEWVWISVKKFGFEGGRALIRKDSAFIINRLNNEYYAEPLSYLEKTYGVPADLAALQNILLGNPVFLQTSGFQLDESPEHYRLSGQGGGFESRFQINKTDLTLAQMELEDPKKLQSVRYSLSNYGELAGNRKFSYLRLLELNSPSSGKMSAGIEFSDVEINVPKDNKFEIPEKYTRVQGK